jgi:hypothetical protein
LELGVASSALGDMLQNVQVLKANWDRVEKILQSYFEEDQ